MFGIHESESSSSSSGVDLKLYPEAVVTDTKLFQKSEGKTFEETDSLNSFYKPIESYEGRHRFDPQFEWEAAEEKRVVRKVCILLSVLYARLLNVTRSIIGYASGSA